MKNIWCEVNTSLTSEVRRLICNNVSENQTLISQNQGHFSNGHKFFCACSFSHESVISHSFGKKTLNPKSKSVCPSNSSFIF
ncbi:hypothetical protein VIGAN_01231800, partial [Vigna angularis var. angularis]